jgi:O-antigen ligase
LFSSFAVKVQVSDEYVTTGLIIGLYVFILAFFFKNFDFISFALEYYNISILLLLSAFKRERTR